MSYRGIAIYRVAAVYGVGWRVDGLDYVFNTWAHAAAAVDGLLGSIEDTRADWGNST